MKSAPLYSCNKFLSFSLEKQYKAVDKLILAMEAALGKETELSSLICHLKKLADLLKPPLPDKLRCFLDGLRLDSSPPQLLKLLNTYHDAALRKDSQLFIRKGDGSSQGNPEQGAKAAQITLICDNLRSVFNVGTMFRNAECLGLGQILLCGITPTPVHANISKTAMGTEMLVPWQHFTDTGEAILYCRNRGQTVYALETVAQAASVFNTSFQYPLAMVVGNESLGIEPKYLELCDAVVTLPLLGWKNSLNVGVAAAAALYQIVFGETNG